jgi:aldehyde dehydrogenase (NAD+)
MGPLVDAHQLETVTRYLDIGKQEGARVRVGGGRPKDPALARGFFVEPTVFDGVRADMRIAQEEIFGPVLSIIEVADFDQALAVANNVRYGLSSSIYTRDLDRAMRFCERIDTGIVHVNSPTVGGEAHLPFGGMKATGVGEREMGRTAIEFYTQWKTVYIDYTGTRRTTKVY